MHKFKDCNSCQDYCRLIEHYSNLCFAINDYSMAICLCCNKNLNFDEIFPKNTIEFETTTKRFILL